MYGTGQKQKNSIGWTTTENLYEMDCVADPQHVGTPDIAFIACSFPKIDLWHHRLVHLNERYLQDLIKHKMVTGIDELLNSPLGPCSGSAKGKHPHPLFPKHGAQVKSLLYKL